MVVFAALTLGRSVLGVKGLIRTAEEVAVVAVVVGVTSEMARNEAKRLLRI